jgi:hypothetical protein
VGHSAPCLPPYLPPYRTSSLTSSLHPSPDSVSESEVRELADRGIITPPAPEVSPAYLPECRLQVNLRSRLTMTNTTSCKYRQLRQPIHPPKPQSLASDPIAVTTAAVGMPANFGFLESQNRVRHLEHPFPTRHFALLNIQPLESHRLPRLAALHEVLVWSSSMP